MNALSSYTLLLPVKPPAFGKSRLGPMPLERRQALATAFALDAIEVAAQVRSVARVLVVTDDFRFAAAAQQAGCAVVPDGVAGDLNGTLVQAAHEAERRWPGCRVAALCADVPALRADDLEQALNSAGQARSAFVRDAEGTGTSLYAAVTRAHFTPRFGVDSAQHHLDSGATEITGALTSLRRDVDDPQDLSAAMALGVGAHTAAALLT